MAIHDESAYEFSLNSGKDSDKPTDPHAGDIYISTDTGVLNICFDGSAWIEQPLPIPSPLSVDANGALMFENKPLVTALGIETFQGFSNSAAFTPPADIMDVYLNTPSRNGNIMLVSTSATVAALAPENIIAVSHIVQTVFILKKSAFVPRAPLYGYAGHNSTLLTLEEVYNRLPQLIKTQSGETYRMNYTPAAAVKVIE